ncbi:hypothetical protein B5S28_g1871 [[Candida] boidinii]|nr:hypothetical protein B5S28_g1871 [[Candida] boidinii]OWB61722.1 hypothetical protein B5S29_g2625 [[Candida] boidinii]
MEVHLRLQLEETLAQQDESQQSALVQTSDNNITLKNQNDSTISFASITNNAKKDNLYEKVFKKKIEEDFITKDKDCIFFTFNPTPVTPKTSLFNTTKDNTLLDNIFKSVFDKYTTNDESVFKSINRIYSGKINYKISEDFEEDTSTCESEPSSDSTQSTENNETVDDNVAVESNKKTKVAITLSLFEVQAGQIKDLFTNLQTQSKSSKSWVDIVIDPINKKVTPANLSQHYVDSLESAIESAKYALNNKNTTTQSHCFAFINVLKLVNKKTVSCSRITIADLAGLDPKKLNQSKRDSISSNSENSNLMELGRCLELFQLNQFDKSLIRSNKLTRLIFNDYIKNNLSLIITIDSIDESLNNSISQVFRYIHPTKIMKRKSLATSSSSTTSSSSNTRLSARKVSIRQPSRVTKSVSSIAPSRRKNVASKTLGSRRPVIPLSRQSTTLTSVSNRLSGVPSRIIRNRNISTSNSAASVAEIETLKKQKLELQDKLNQMELKLVENEQSLRNELFNDKENEINQLNTQHNTEIENLKKNEELSINEKLNELSENYQTKINNLTMEVTEKSNHMNKMEDEIKELKTQINSEISEKENFKSVNHQHLEDVKLLNDEIKIKISLIDELKGENNKLEDMIKEATINFENDKSELDGKINVLKSSLATKNEENENLQVKIDELNKNIEVLKNDLNNKDSNSMESIESLNKEIESLNKEIESLQSQLNDKVKEISELKSNSENEINKINDLKQEISEKNSNLEADNNSLNFKINELEKKFEIIKTSNSNYQSTIEEIENNKKLQISSLETKLEQKEQRIMKLKHELQTTKTSLDMWKKPLNLEDDLLSLIPTIESPNSSLMNAKFSKSKSSSPYRKVTTKLSNTRVANDPFVENAPNLSIVNNTSTVDNNVNNTKNANMSLSNIIGTVFEDNNNTTVNNISANNTANIIAKVVSHVNKIEAENKQTNRAIILNDATQNMNEDESSPVKFSPLKSNTRSSLQCLSPIRLSDLNKSDTRSPSVESGFKKHSLSPNKKNKKKLRKTTDENFMMETEELY